jgi:hypothetical protein
MNLPSYALLTGESGNPRKQTIVLGHGGYRADTPKTRKMIRLRVLARVFLNCYFHNQ